MEEQLGYAWLDAVHPDDRDRTFAAWSAAVESRSTLDVEFRIRRFDGVYRWFATRAVPELDAANTITRWYGTNTDIEDRRQTEQELDALRRSLEARVEARTLDLRTAQTQLEMAQRITMTGSWSYDLASNQVEWSDELFRILRLPISATCPQYEEQPALFHPESWPILDRAVAAAAAEGTPYVLELRLADSHEGPRFAQARGHAERDANGNTTRLYGTFQDVTTLVRTRIERDTLLERINLATEFGAVGIWDWDIERNILTWNPQMYRLFDIPIDHQPTYETWRNAVVSDDLGATEAALRHAIANSTDFSSQYRIIQRDGSERVVRAMARLESVHGRSGNRMIGVCLDVTLEAVAERIRSGHLDRLREFIRGAPAAIAMFDRDLRYLEASRRWVELYAPSTVVLTGRTHYDVVPETPDELRTAHQLALDGRVVSGSETELRRKDGSRILVNWEGRPWRLDTGEIGGIIMFTYDVTDAVRLRLEMERQSSELRRSNEDLQQFAYAASHDMQEPLRAISGFAQILTKRLSGRIDQDSEELLGHMVEGAARMRLLIDDLLAFSRAGSGDTHFALLPLQDLIDAACRPLELQIRETSAVIECGPLPTAFVDRRLVTQLFQNLLGNSIKYCGPRPPRIRVWATTSGNSHEVVVQDEGIGIPRDAAERVFQMFQRLHTRDEYAGSGVGLALCRRIVERHGGRIWVMPSDGAGCEIRFTLPHHPEESEP